MAALRCRAPRFFSSRPSLALAALLFPKQAVQLLVELREPVGVAAGLTVVAALVLYALTTLAERSTKETA